MKAVQWAPSGNPGDGIPSEIVRLLSRDDGHTYGYGYGPGTSMMFGSEHGDVTVSAGQWVVRNDDGSIEVRDDAPDSTGPR